MKYRIISLIMIIPVVLMLCVFSAVGIVTLSVPIPVVGINLSNNIEEYLDIANSSDSLQIKASVEPRNASNGKILYTTEPIEGKKEARVSIDLNGKITPLDVGSVKVICTTVDGAYVKSFVLEVGSTKATDFTVALPDGSDIVVVGDEFTFLSQVYPTYIDAQIEWECDDPSVLEVNRYTGEARAISADTVTVTAIIQDGINGQITKTFEITVVEKATDSGILINGKETYQTKTYNNTIEVYCYVNPKDVDDNFVLTEDILSIDYDLSDIESIEKTVVNNNLILLTIVTKDGYTGQSEIKASLDLPQYAGKFATISIDKVGDGDDFDLSVSGLKEYIKLGSKNLFEVNLLPQMNSIEYQVDIADESICSLMQSENIFQITALKVGSTDITISALKDDVCVNSVETSITVLNPATSINLVESATTYGISNEMAIGGYVLENGEYVEDSYQFSIAGDVQSQIQWTSSDESVATISDGDLTILKSGKTTISATDKASILLNKPVSSSITIRCVADGVNISNYSDLMKASKDKKEIILQNHIDLGEKLLNVNDDGSVTLLKDKSECARILKDEVSQMPTTGDWSYYKYANGATTPPLINYCIRFDNNLYGNGFTLNANNITNMVDGTGSLYDFAVFRGGLDLVKLKSGDTDSSSVKAQDNISFVVGENVRIDNVELVGANLRGKTTTDLNQLNYVGTTVEVMGDNVEIVNSRIRNGKNVLRVFGDEKDTFKKINVTLSSCVLSYAREFLVRLGTNAIIKGEYKDKSYNLSQGISDNSPIWDECAPSIGSYRHLNDKMSVAEYNALNEQYLNDEDYLSLVKTNLTLENCSMLTSGLFSIGIEGHFAGPALDGGRWNSWDFYAQGWRELAGTAYPVQLNLKGKVSIYDWKVLENIDSSSLMEGNLFDIDMSNMIKSVGQKDEFSDIITKVDNQNYVHSGIAVFGGGKNYGIISMDGQIEEFANYSISLQDIGSSLTKMMTYASGKESFRFLLYNKNSHFTYGQQQLEISNGTAYSKIGKYIY